jgi:predicted transposase/invertase (TIGR01784 family)
MPDAPIPPHHLHDSLFKETFGRPDIAADFLRNYLPAEISNLFNLDGLKQQRETFIDAELQEHFSDLLYQAPLRDGRSAYIYLLFEYKSYPDR